MKMVKNIFSRLANSECYCSVAGCVLSFILHSAIIAPQGKDLAELDEHEHWVGKIKELRAPKNAQESLDVLSIPLTFSIPPIDFGLGLGAGSMVLVWRRCCPIN
jgi:hypothetical protein